MAYFDKYGVEFSDDRKTLIKCPRDFQGEYTIPNVVTNIASHAFANCKGLTNIVCSENLRNIEIYAFENCINLGSIETPNNILISPEAFIGCLRLETIFPFGHILDKYIHIRVQHSYDSHSSKRGGFWGRTITIRSKIFIDKSVKLNMRQIGIIQSFIIRETTEWEEIDAYNDISPNEYLRNDQETTRQLVSLLGESFVADFKSDNLVDICDEYEPMISYYIACSNNITIFKEYISRNIELPFNIVSHIYTHLLSILNNKDYSEGAALKDIYSSKTSEEYYKLLKTEIAQHGLDKNEKYGILLVCKTLKQIITEILQEAHLKEICSVRKKQEYDSAHIKRPINNYEVNDSIISVSGTSLYHYIRHNINTTAGIIHIELYPLDLALLFNDSDFYEFLKETGAYATEYAEVVAKLNEEKNKRVLR